MSRHIAIWRFVHKNRAEAAYSSRESYPFSSIYAPRNTPVIYAAENPSQAILETLLHLGDALLLERDYLLVPAKIPESGIYAAEQFDRDLFQKHLALRLPSKIPSEYLILLNPSHQDYSLLKVGNPTKISNALSQ